MLENFAFNVIMPSEDPGGRVASMTTRRLESKTRDSLDASPEAAGSADWKVQSSSSALGGTAGFDDIEEPVNDACNGLG